MGVIYKITSPTGRMYVGKTVHLGRRINTYKYKIIKNVGWVNAKIMNSLQKYGWDAHKFEIIEEVPNELLNEKEMFWIKELGTYCYENNKHMNMSRGGEEGGRIWMDDVERRNKQSKRFTKEGNPFYGKSHTEEFKLKKSKEVSEYNKRNGIKIPEWGVEKGRLKVIKPVLCYNSKGKFIKEFISYTEAGNFIGVKPSRVWESVSGRRSQCNGYHFRDKSDNYPLQIDITKVKQKCVKRPILYLFNSYKIEYPSSAEASKELGLPKTSINRASLYNNLRPLRSGHIFIYKDLYEQKVKKIS